jgi:hypothetical protein
LLEVKDMSAERLIAPVTCAILGFLSPAWAQTDGEIVASTLAREACAVLSTENYQACCIAANRAEILSSDAQVFCSLSAEEQARRITAAPATPEVQAPPVAGAPAPAADAAPEDPDHVSHSGLGDGTNPGAGSASNNAGDTPGGQGVDNPGGGAGGGGNGPGNGNGQENGNGNGNGGRANQN